MRRGLTLALMCCVVGSLTLGSRAEAGVSYDFVFRTGGGGFANGNQYIFPGPRAASGGEAVADVILRTSDALIVNSISVEFDNSLGLGVSTATEWSGLSIPGSFYSALEPGVAIGPDTLKRFDSAAPPPNGPPSLSPGTYNIGTIIWDTSNAEEGFHFFSFFLDPGIDATGAVLPAASNNIVNISGTEVLGSGFINIIPEPSTAALLAVALLGLALSGRRRAQSR